jgi:hypothetical protein
MGKNGIHTNFDTEISWEISLGKPRKAVKENITMNIRKICREDGSSSGS